MVGGCCRNRICTKNVYLQFSLHSFETVVVWFYIILPAHSAAAPRSRRLFCRQAGTLGEADATQLPLQAHNYVRARRGYRPLVHASNSRRQILAR